MGYVTVHTIWIDRLVLALSAAFNFILLALLSKQIYSKSKQAHKSSKTNLELHIKILHLSALGTLFFNGLFNVIRVPVSFGVFHFITCGFQSGLLCSLWTTGKYFLYLFFITRLDVAFCHSVYSLSRRSFVMLYTLVTFGWIMQQIVIVITWKGEFVVLFNEPWQFCATATHVWVFVYLVIYDAIITIALLSIFIQKLHSVSSRRHSVCDDEINVFWNKISKYVTLTVVGVLSTLICMIMVGVTSWITFTAADTNINSMCVFLMYGANSELFHTLCFCCYHCGKTCVNQVTDSKLYGGSMQKSNTKLQVDNSSVMERESIKNSETA